MQIYAYDLCRFIQMIRVYLCKFYKDFMQIYAYFTTQNPLDL
ncbi:hypothetical protein HMPREF1574_00220 [Gardnerella pickettii JCP7659]|uniref:Uncharacterized protein n=1 Tax=Gardnerella pickettii JCP8017A TaxID=1261062 RepID=T2PJD6_9BIFI|nr:hypothetical protein HMPREF1582_00572 [Gardnerella vaginalis JCP8151A]EPI51292.1 hypothetical protein HMPREF1577_01115 [Gardnerella pickettii JCP8017A]EPI55976.1 hypothetical protein HMPREF1574_00220 [Gardnerella pickettii JCP7659]EPI59985.1 hypothetical protein HMPREF1578_01240 [Gardnerella pickettii JCP8017B]